MAVPTLQIPGYAAPSAIDFSPLANLGQVYQKAQQDAVRKQTLSSLGQGGGPLDYGDAARKLLSVGDTQGAMSLAQLGNNQRDFAFRLQEAQRAQSNADRLYALQAKNAEGKPTIQKVKDLNGNETLVRVMPDGTTSALNVPGQGGSADPINPFSSGKMTNDQAKAATMVDRMAQANQTITKNEDINDFDSPKGGYIGGVLAASPWVRDSALFNTFASPDRQATIQAQRNFVNAILRQESGAAVSESEFNNAQRQYFPQAGDSKQVIEEKRQNRIAAMEGMARQAGPAYRPPASLTGRSVPTQPQQRQQAVAAPPAAISALRSNPSLRAQFDAKYGQGASAQVLGQ